MDVNNAHNNGNFAYDPAVYGYSAAFWAQVAGAGTAASTGSGITKKIRLNAARIASLVCFRYVSASFWINVPVAPTAGDVRSWGFRIPSLSNLGRVGFDTTDTAFKCVVYDNDGTLLASKTITWDAAWTATETKYKIVWFKNGVRFFIGSTCVFKTEFGGSGATKPAYPTATPVASTPSLPVMLDINNANADNMDVGVITLKDISAWN